MIIIPLIIAAIGLYLIYQSLKEKTGCGCLALVLTVLLFLVIVGRFLIG